MFGFWCGLSNSHGNGSVLSTLAQLRGMTCGMTRAHRHLTLGMDPAFRVVERSLRSVAVGLRIGTSGSTKDGDCTSAVLSGLIETAKAADIDPRTDLRDVFPDLVKVVHVATLIPHVRLEHREPVVPGHRFDLLEFLVPGKGAAELVQIS